MNTVYTIGTSSASHTYGNVMSCFKLMMDELFPEHFITHTYIDSKLAWKDVTEVLGNSDREFKKRHYPFMIIHPRMDHDPGRYLYNTPLTKNMDNVEAGLSRNTLFPIVRDLGRHMELAYKINRDVITFEVELRLKSEVQQNDVYKNLENQLLWERPHTKEVSLESMLPKSMVTYVGKIAGIDLGQSTERENLCPLLLRYLNGHAFMPITYKIRNSTAVDEFFMYYTTNLLITYSDLDKPDGTKKGNLDDYYPVTFRVDVEFNLPGLYALLGDHKMQWAGLKFSAMVGNDGDQSGYQMIPMYTFTNLYRNLQMETQDGFKFYSNTVVMVEEKNAGKDEVIDLNDIIPYDHMQILKEFRRNGIPPETLFRIRLLADNRELYCDAPMTDACPCSWEVNWDTMTLTIHYGNPYWTYRIIVYANILQLNEKLLQYQNATKMDLDKIPTSN